MLISLSYYILRFNFINVIICVFYRCMKMMIKDNTVLKITFQVLYYIIFFFHYFINHIVKLVKIILKYTYENIKYLVLNVESTSKFNYIYIISLYKIKL